MKKLFFIGMALLIVCIFTVPVTACDDPPCLNIDIGGDIGLRDGQWQDVKFTPAPADSNHTEDEFNSGQYIDGWGCGGDDFTGEGEAIKEQTITWQNEDDLATHFGAAYDIAYGKWGVSPECNESQLNVDTYNWSKTQTGHEKSDNGLYMDQYTDMNDGGTIIGSGNPLAGGFEIDHTAGSYHEIGNPDCDPIYGWQYNWNNIAIKAGTIPNID